MDASPDNIPVYGTILATLGGLASGYLAARRKLSKDKVELAKDRAELDVMSFVTKQRDELSEELKLKKAEILQGDIEKKSALARALQFEQELVQLRQKVALLKQLVGRLATTLDLVKDQLKKTLENQKS